MFTTFDKDQASWQRFQVTGRMSPKNLQYNLRGLTLGGWMIGQRSEGVSLVSHGYQQLFHLFQGCHMSGKSHGKTNFSRGQGIVRDFWKNGREFCPVDTCQGIFREYCYHNLILFPEIIPKNIFGSHFAWHTFSICLLQNVSLLLWYYNDMCIAFYINCFKANTFNIILTLIVFVIVTGCHLTFFTQNGITLYYISKFQPIMVEVLQSECLDPHHR